MSPDEFKDLIPRLTDSEIVTQVVLPGAAAHVTDENILYLSRRIAETFGVDTDEIDSMLLALQNLASLSQRNARMARSYVDIDRLELALILTWR
jgi:hypothetical protein